MAVLSKMDLSPPCQHLCSPISPKKSPFSIGFSSIQFQTLESSSLTHFNGQKMAFSEELMKPKRGNLHPLHAQSQMNYCISKALKWWEKGLQRNMKEIQSAFDLVDSLLNAGNNLVVVDFFSPGCGGCKALHPKICQIAGQNPEVQFLQVNYEEHKSMCYSLNVHVLPFLWFYRGAQGRLCSFSCTNATIKKFKDALAKHRTDRCNLGPTKGLEESELVALAANRDLSFNYTGKLAPASAQKPAEKAATSLVVPPLPSKTSDQMFEKTLTMASG